MPNIVVHRLLISATAVCAISLLSGCGHTNHLAEYHASGAKVLFRYGIEGGAASAHTHITPPDTTAAAGVLTSISEGIANSALQSKLDHVPANLLVRAVSDGLRQSMLDYLHSIEVRTTNEQPVLIVQTVLKSYELQSSATDAHAVVTATSRIVDRGTGNVVWENSETQTVPLGGVSSPARHGRNVVNATSGAMNATMLISLSDDQLRDILVGAADEVGYAMGETMRKDVAELKAH